MQIRIFTESHSQWGEVVLVMANSGDGYHD